MFTYVLSHYHSGVYSSESLAHDADLFRGDVVDIHKDALGESVAAVLNSCPNFVFSFFCSLHDGHIE